MEPDEVAALLDVIDVPMIPAPESELAPPPYSPRVALAASWAPRYLVTLADAVDRYPVGLFDHREEAVVFARDVAMNPDVYGEKAAALLGSWPASPWTGVAVTEFDGPVASAHTELFDCD